MTAIGGSRSKNSTILLLVLSSICCSTFADAFSITTPSTSSSSSTSTSFSLSLSQQQQQPCDVPSDVDDDATLLLKDSNSIRNAIVTNVDGEKLSLGDLIGIEKDEMTSVVVFLRHMG